MKNTRLSTLHKNRRISQNMTLLAVKTFGVILGVLPRLSGSQCHRAKQAILSVIQITVTISKGVGYGSLYIAYLWIPGYGDTDMSMKITEALCTISLFICSLLIILWMWKHSRSLSSVIKTCNSSTPEGTYPPDVSPHLIQTSGVAVNMFLLWFIIFQALYEGIVYGLWYMIYDMNIGNEFLKVLFLILHMWITIIVRYPQILWVAIGTALQHQFAHFNRVIEDAARADPRVARAVKPPAAETGEGVIVVLAARSHDAKDGPECQERGGEDTKSCSQAERSDASDASSHYQKVRANLAYMRKRYQQLQQVLRDVEAVMAGPLLISSFYTFSATIICLFHGIALDISLIFKILTMTQCALQIIILWIQGQVADSIIAEGQKTSHILMEIAEAATEHAPLPPKAKQTILVMSMERLSRKGLGTRVCGLFTLSRRNTLAVAGASTSYLLILLQFHLADL